MISILMSKRVLTLHLLSLLVLLEFPWSAAVADELSPYNHTRADFIEHILSGINFKPPVASILAGVPCEIENAKYQASLRWKSQELTFFRKDFICGAAIISQRVALTAAHCVYDNSLKPPKRREDNEFTVVMGSSLLHTKSWVTLQYDVQKIMVHGAFNSTSLANDIAMVLFNGYIPWKWSTVQAIPLNTKELAEQQQCTITGWATTYYGNISEELSVAQVPIVEWCRCKITQSLSEGMLCAGAFQKSASKQCLNDSGGPLVCNGMLAGIVSSFVGCAQQLYPGIYMNVSYYHDWIVTTNSSFNYSHYGSDERYMVNSVNLTRHMEV